MSLTVAQLRVFEYIESCFKSGGGAPTCREICQHCGYKSPRAATEMLNRLQKAGYIALEGGKSRNIRILKKRGIPLLGEIPAGFPSAQTTAPDCEIQLGHELFGIKSSADTFALRVRGDSMIGRKIFDGDIVMLESGAALSHESIVAALIDNESTLKTLLIRDGRAWLRAENPLYPDLTPAWDLQIQGVARAVIRRLSP